MGRPKGAKSIRTRLAEARAKIASQEIDYAVSYDSLELMEKVMRHFFLRAMVEQSLGLQTDWKEVDALMMRTAQVAEKVAAYKHAKLSAVRLEGDLSKKPTDGTLDELLRRIETELTKLAPILDLEVVREPGSRGSAA